MPQMTPANARVVDPVLTTVARGYKNGQMVADVLFPVVFVASRGGKIISFGKEAFRLYATARIAGSNTPRVQFGYAGLPFALEQAALEGMVSVELLQEAGLVPGIDLASNAVASVQAIIALAREHAAARIATNLANYPASHKLSLAASDKWDNYESATSNPLTNVDDAIEAVRAYTGQRPNSVVLSPKAFKAAKRHPKVLGHFNKINAKEVVSVADLAAAFDVAQVVVGDAIVADGDTMSDVWGSDVVVAFTHTAPVAGGGLPSYGYTYRLRGYPMVEAAYLDRNTKSWIYPVTDELSPVLSCAEAGFLLKGVV